MAIEIQRVPLGADVTGHVASLLRDAARSAPPFAPAPVIYVASNERRAKLVSRLAGEQYPEGTPDRVARELLALMAPDIRLRGEIERDFDFFGALGATLSELGEKRRVGRALVDELLIAWKRLAQTIPPSQRESLGWLAKTGRRGELLAGVVRRYLTRLADLGRHDPEDALWLAAERMNVKPALVVVDDLDQISSARVAFLRALSNAASRTLIILRGNRDALPFLADAHGISQALMFEADGQMLPEREWEARPQAEVCDAWLQDASVSASVQVLRPATRAAEVRESARAVKRAHAGGVALNDICVAMPSTSNYRELVEEIFAASGIPYDAPFEIPLDETAPVAALLDLVRAARNGLTRGDLLDALGSPFVPFGRTEPEQREFRAVLDEVTRESRIVGGTDIHNKWLNKLDAVGHAKWPELKASLLRIFGVLAPFTGRRMQSVEYYEAMEALLEGASTQHTVEADRQQNDRGATMRADALHAFQTLLRDMREESRRGGNPELSMAELIRALTEQAHTRSVRPPETSGERVRVLGLRELRGMSFQRLIVLGLTDQDLPLGEQETMFLPASREETIAGLLDRQAARELCSPIDVTAQADYLFAHTLLAAGGALTLSFPSAEGETPFVPATPFARLLRCMNLDVDGLPATVGEELPTSPGDFAARVAEVLNESDAGGGKLPLDSPVLRSGLHGRCIELARTDLASPPGEYEGVIGESVGLSGRFALAGDERHTFSPSQIDTYAECPMRFWARYIIRAKATEEPTMDTKPHAIGTLLHEVFERWVLLLRQELGQPVIEPDPTLRQPARLADVPDDARAAGLRLMAEAFDYACAHNPGEGPFWDGMKKLVAAGLPGHPDDGLGDGLLVRFVDAELARNAEGHAIRFVEFDFGKDNPPTPDRPDTVPGLIELEIPGGTIRLMGSVDRVDESPDGLEIIDYKTGGVKTTAEIRDGKAFQLPTYLAAISRIAGTPPRGMTYLQVPTDGAIKNHDVTKFNRKDAYDVNQLVTERLPARLSRMLGAVRNGVFLHTPFTSPDKACKWCDYASSCGRRADVIAERAQRLAEEEAPEVEHVYLPDKGEA